jgi:hypothetical protein
MNFGEELAYWYLRLNGFFPLSNFVLHQDGRRKASDCDVLAVRPPFVHEDVGGNPADWDAWIPADWNGGRTLGVICEVKSGNRPQALFDDYRVRQSVDRLGFAQDLAAIDFETLKEQGHVDVGEQYRIIKLLVAETRPRVCTFRFIRIADAREFIKNRIRFYKQKRG